MNDKMSLVALVWAASPVVQLVLLLLLLASVASWAIIVRKRVVLRGAVASSDRFESDFWSGGDLTEIYHQITRGGGSPAAMAGVFEAGFRAFRRLTQQGGVSPQVRGSRPLATAGHRVDRQVTPAGQHQTYSDVSGWLELAHAKARGDQRRAEQEALQQDVGEGLQGQWSESPRNL